MRKITHRRLTSKWAIIAYLIMLLVLLNNFISLVSNIDFVITAQGNSRLVKVWNFFSTPKGNFIAVILAVLWITCLALWPEKGLAHFDTLADNQEPAPPPKSGEPKQHAREKVTTKVVEVEPNIVALEVEPCTAHYDQDGVIIEGERVLSRGSIVVAA